MNKSRSTKAADPIGDGIRALSDAKLSSLITALSLNTKLEQSALHKARAEARRRKKAKGKAPL
jgi:hypothetical protein